ncbi:MAG TPA: hypothetical protein VJM12_14040 [Pyrinomonadaceae bacterium]|nr:hypothetical protein [Pyrinomonadaceae bacterium]
MDHYYNYQRETEHRLNTNLDIFRLNRNLIALISFFLGGAGWVAIPLAGIAFFATVALIFFWHWISAAGEFSAHWKREAEAKSSLLESSDAKKCRREFLAQRLSQLLKEAAEVDFGAVELGGGRGIAKLTRSANHHGRVRRFLEAHWDEAIVKRYEEDGNGILEHLLAEVLNDDQNATPKLAIAFPKLEIKIIEITYAWSQDTKPGRLVDPPCFITMLLEIKNPRPVPIAIEMFKLSLRLGTTDYVSYAEDDVYGRRLISEIGDEYGECLYTNNLNSKATRPLMLIQDQPKRGTLQFVFRELQYMKAIIDGTDKELKGAPFTLFLQDTNWELHRQEDNLPNESGGRYVNR